MFSFHSSSSQTKLPITLKVIACAFSLSPTLAAAHCDDFPEFGQMLGFSMNVSGANDASVGQVTQINDFLASSLFQERLSHLMSAGHADTVHGVILLADSLKTILRYKMSAHPQAAKSFAQSSGFATVRANANNSYETICHDIIPPKEEEIAKEAPKPEEEPVHTILEVSQPSRVAIEPVDTARYIDWGMVLISGWVVLALFLLVLHFGMIAIATKRRQRNTCKIPASLRCGPHFEISGYINILGRYGNSFKPNLATDAQDLKAIQKDMACTIEIGAHSREAKIRYNKTNFIGMLFFEPLKDAEIAKFLSHSLIAPKPDFSGVNKNAGTQYKFGLGQLPPIPKVT